MGATAGFAQSRVLVATVGVAVVLSSVSALAGWIFQIPQLTRVGASWHSMVPATALAFLFAAASLLLRTRWSRRPDASPVQRRFFLAAQACAALPALAGIVTLLEFASGAQWHVEFLGVRTVFSGTVSLATACGLVLLGSALLLSGRRGLERTAQVLCALTVLVGWLGISRYLYGGAPLTPHVSMAFQSALSFLALSTATLTLGAPVGLVGLLSGKGAAGSSARLLLPAALLLPLLLAWLPLAGQRAGWLGGEAGLALFALSMAAISSALVWLHAARLARSEEQRQAALEALSSGEERTRLIIEGALDAVVSIDRGGHITGWNARAEALFGWMRTEVQGRELVTTIIPSRYADAHRRGMRRFLEGGESRVLNRRVELSAVDRSGREFPVELAITPIRTSQGMAFSAFLRDITERREALAALHESEQRFRTLAESLPHLVWTCRPDGWCDYLSRQWVQYTGLPESAQLGYGWAGQLHPDDRARAQQEWAAATRRGDYFDIEFRIRRHDGAYRWFTTRAVPLRDANDNIVRWFGSNTDVEDHKSVQQALRLQIDRLSLLDRSTRAIGERQDLRDIFQSVLGSLENELTVDFGCICTYDPAGRSLTVCSIGAASRRFVTVLQLPEGARIEIDANGLAKSVSGRLVHEPDLAASTAPFSRRLRDAGLGCLVLAPLAVESQIFGVLIAARCNAGSFSSNDCEFLRQLSGHVALAARQAELYGNLHAAYDDLRRTQETVMQQERLRSLGQMASGVAHDINNALSPVALYVQSMLEHETGLSARGREHLKIVEQSVESVAGTIGRLREFYRERELQQGQEAVHPNLAIEQAAELTRARWHDMPQQRGVVIELKMELAPALPTIAGTASELRDAVTNLILNAVDAMPHGGTLTLRSLLLPGEDESPDSGAQVEVTIRDTGVGMTPEARSRCLEPFYTTKGARGTGLGLAMVYGMLERHGARIEIDSAPDRGTEMRLLFPVSRVAAPAPAEVRAAPLPALHLLLVDDDPVLLRSLREILEGDGHRISTADGGQAGIDILLGMEAGGEGVSAVITDLGMPHVDGRKVAAAAKSLRNPPPVIMLTGWGQRLIDDGDVPAHVDRVLGKPPKLAQLRAVLAELVR